MRCSWGLNSMGKA